MHAVQITSNARAYLHFFKRIEPANKLVVLDNCFHNRFCHSNGWGRLLGAHALKSQKGCQSSSEGQNFSHINPIVHFAVESFKDGSLVKGGDLLFSIDKREFETALRQAEAQISIAEAAFDFSKGQLARAESLIQNGNISQSVVDERRESHLEARGALEQAKAALERAQIDYDYTEIRAPISGRIDQKLLDAGNLVNANETILTTIVSQDPIYFFFDIDERYYLSYARDARTRGTTLQEGGGGLEVVVTLSDESIPPISGRLDFSENRIDPATGTMRIRAVLGNAEGVLTPGLFGRVTVPGSLPYEGILVPDNAIVADQNRRLVMMVDEDGNVSPRPVRPGPMVDGYRVIREGLSGSETIVVLGIVRARPGAVVAPELVVLPPVAGQ